jgi:uncharacterized protein (TIGR00730 family)
VSGRAVAVFCGASLGADPAYVAAAEAVGAGLARAGHTLVYGGSSRGLMGRLADAALAAGGAVVGVIPQSLVAQERAHGGLAALHVVGSMHERKARMAELADAFVALPGGIGTLDELFEIWTWRQLGFHAKPIACYDVRDYFAPLLGFLDRATDEGFLGMPSRQLLARVTDVPSLLSHVVP